MYSLTKMHKFRFWCQKVLPLVYDNSLSYYEVLCKVVDYINNLIETDNQMIGTIAEMQDAISELQTWVNNFDNETEEVLRGIIDRYITTSVFFGLTQDGYFVAYIPDSWDEITFGTSGLDDFPAGVDYGHLTLSY